MTDPEQAEYLEEIAELERRLVELEESEAAPELLQEYSTEVSVLKALLEATLRLRERLLEEPELAVQLSQRGFSAGRFSDLYAFVYDASLEIERAGEAFAREITGTDFAGLLREG